MLNRNIWIAGAFAAFALVTAAAFAAQDRSAIDPAKADKDFAVQGEYAGDVDTQDGKAKVGAQIIALGDGKFHGVFYIGGLPGNGWDTTREKYEADGQTTDNVTTFTVQEITVKIEDGAMTGTNNTGAQIGSIKKVTRKSPTLGAKAPEGAIVLFDGSNGDEWQPGKMDGKLLTQGQNSKRKFQGGTLHVEFYLPYEPKGRGQGRANSGVYLQSRYEVQVLDSFGLEGKNNECGGIYTISDPLVNMCYPPLQWQTYDIDFAPAQFDQGGKKIKNARMTVKHNGVLVQDNVEVPHATTAAPLPEGPTPAPIHLQDHGHPVRYQNIWFVEKK